MTFPHWSRVTLYTSTCVFAECCVFVKQSHGPFHCASRHCPEGPLLPKLRGHVAEFLNEVSPARLGMFVPSHLCRFPKLRGHVAEFLNEVSPARLGMFVPSHLCRFWYGLPFSIGCFFSAAWTHGLAGANPRSARTFRRVRGIAISPFHCPSATHPLEPLRQVQEC